MEIDFFLGAAFMTDYMDITRILRFMASGTAMLYPGVSFKRSTSIMSLWIGSTCVWRLSALRLIELHLWSVWSLLVHGDVRSTLVSFFFGNSLAAMRIS